MPRYAVLLDLEDPDLRPIALLTEHDDAVRAHFAVECGLKSEYRDAYVVWEPDGEAVRYEPGRPEYFNSVINTFSRGFVVNELETRETLSARDVVELYLSKIVLPRAPRETVYASSCLDVMLRRPAPTGAVSYTPAASDPQQQAGPALSDESLLARAA